MMMTIRMARIIRIQKSALSARWYSSWAQ